MTDLLDTVPCYLCGEDRAPDCDDGQDHCGSCRSGCPICGPEDHRWDEADRAWVERKEGRYV